MQHLAFVKANATKRGKTFFIQTALLVVFAVAFALLYRQNKQYQFQNQRLIIVNDSILSENIELKNALKQKTSTVLKIRPENFKKEIK